MTERIYNFSPGPAVLPVTVLEEAKKHLMCYPGAGMSILEMSHRSKTFEGILNETIGLIRELYGVPDNYHVLFMGGGASLQFSMVPMNLLAPGKSADYIITGVWAEKALKEAKKVGTVRIAASTAEGNHKRIPNQSELDLDKGAVYVHMTTNNTIYGTQWHAMPETGDVPLIADFSSDMFWAPLNISKFGLLYGGIQKNLGPAGAVMMIVRKDLAEKAPKGIPTMLDYKTHAENNSLYNTPPVFPIYLANLTLKWIKDGGGLAAMHKRNLDKAKLIYDAIDESGGFYRGHAEKDARSAMNVTFRLPTEDLEKAFAKQSEAIGLDGLKGHRSAGGMRASIYNAFPRDGVEKLVEFMHDFKKKNG